MLPSDAVRDGHGIGHAGAALEQRGRTVMAAMVSGRSGWFERFVVAPLARSVIPLLVPRTVPVAAVAAGGGIAGLIGWALIAYGHPVGGVLFALLGSVAGLLGAILADLRDERGAERWTRTGAGIVLAGAALLLGRVADGAESDAGMVLATGLILLGVLGERARGDAPRRTWWGDPCSYGLLVWVGVLLSAPLAGLGAGAIYAGATLTAAIERLRRQP